MTSESTPHKSPAMVGFEPPMTKGTIPFIGGKSFIMQPSHYSAFLSPVSSPPPPKFSFSLPRTLIYTSCPITLPFDSFNCCLVWFDPVSFVNVVVESCCADAEPHALISCPLHTQSLMNQWFVFKLVKSCNETTGNWIRLARLAVPIATRATREHIYGNLR